MRNFLGFVFFIFFLSSVAHATEEGDLYVHVDFGNHYAYKKLDNFASVKVGYSPYAFWGYSVFTDALWNQVRLGPEVRFSYEPFEAFVGISSKIYQKSRERFNFLETLLIQAGMSALAPLTPTTAVKVETKLEPDWKVGTTNVFLSLGLRFIF